MKNEHDGGGNDDDDDDDYGDDANDERNRWVVCVYIVRRA